MAAAATPTKRRRKKRALALGGGGPAVGFHIGVLDVLEAAGIEFDIWSLSCIGAWVGIYYNQLEGPQKGKAERTYNFFKEHAFRNAGSYEGFPVNKAFAPHLSGHARAWVEHATSPKTYFDMLNVGEDLPNAVAGWADFLSTPAKWWREGDRNAHVLNNILAIHPLSRFVTSMLYMSGINGLSNIYYTDSSLLDDIKVGRLDCLGLSGMDQMDREQLQALVGRYHSGEVGRSTFDSPEIYHNAWRLTGEDRSVKNNLRLFNNRWLDYRARPDRSKHKARAVPQRPVRDYLPISHASLCACSALPYVEQTVKIPNDDGHEYSEGALVDTVSFRNLVEDHPDLDEIWVCRIVDYRQLRLQKNLHDSLGNLCEQFAAEVGENDIELFKNHLRKSVGRTPRVVEIPLCMDTRINYRWDHDNLACGRQEGARAMTDLLEQHGSLKDPETSNRAWAPVGDR